MAPQPEATPSLPRSAYSPAVEHLTSAAAARLLRQLEHVEAQARILEELLVMAGGPPAQHDPRIGDRLQAARTLLRSLLQDRSSGLRRSGDP